MNQKTAKALRCAIYGDAEESLKIELTRGKKYLPIGDSCKGFDFQKGCPGHKK